MNSPLSKILLPCFILVFCFGYCQQFGTPVNYKNDDGLNSENIINTVNSPSGYLYLATKRGILKYDGYRFINLFKTQAVWSQLHIKDSLIYYHDTEGLFKLNCSTDQTTCILKNNFMDSDPNNDHFNNIFVDSKGRIWGTDFNYVKYYWPKQKKFKTFLIDPENKSLESYSIFEPIDNEIWIASKNGLWVWEETYNKLQLHENDIINKLKYSSGYFFTKNQVFLATETGEILEIDPLTNHLKKWAHLPKNEIVLGFFSVKNAIFCYSPKHIYAMKNGVYSEVYNSEKNKINTVNCDPNTGIFWISTQKGLVKLPRINPGIEIYNFPEKDSLENNVISIVERADKSIWTLTDSGNIWKFQQGKWKLQFKNPLSKNYVLNEVGKELILSTNKGLFIWKQKSFYKIPIKTLKAENRIIEVSR